MSKIAGTKNITVPEKTRLLKLEAKFVAEQGKTNAAKARIKALVAEKKHLASVVTAHAKEIAALKKLVG